MIIIKPSEVTKNILNDDSQMPLFICSDSSRIQRKMIDSGFKELRINPLLSKVLLEYSSQERLIHVEEELQRILANYVSVLVTDFEMLFDPRYEIDVVKLFCEKARIINVAVKWPGKFTGDKLTYAEPECEDYHEYNCSSYQLRIVQ